MCSMYFSPPVSGLRPQAGLTASTLLGDGEQGVRLADSLAPSLVQPGSPIPPLLYWIKDRMA